MDSTQLLQFLPTMEMISEALAQAGIACHCTVLDAKTVYRGIRLYAAGQPVQEDLLYLLRQPEPDFPGDVCACASVQEIPGLGDRLWCPDITPEELLNFLLAFFAECQQIQYRIDRVVFHNLGLQALCDLGAELLENPVCIHDDWFIMTAMSQGMESIMAPEYVASSSKGFVPRVIVEDFKQDSDYLETYVYRGARIWEGIDGAPSSLYVNLWDATIYQGRLLVIQHNRLFRRRDFLLAEVLAQGAVFLLSRKQLGEPQPYQGMDDIVFHLLQGGQPEPAEINQLLATLHWKQTDQFLCARLKGQQTTAATILEHVLHSDLFQLFPGSYILFNGREQCLVVNLTRKPLSAPQLRHLLAPLCRDYCLYAGLSAPVSGLRELNLAYYEAEVALNQAFQMRSEKWIVFFSDCVLSHILNNLPQPLQPWDLISPALRILRRHDLDKGTQYFETFRAYLLQERNIPRAAQTLIIHRTTLLYRLEKIQSLIQVNLDDPEQRLYLLLSFWIWDRIGSQPLPQPGKTGI